MDTIQELQLKLRTFNAVRNWEQYHDPKNLAMLIASEAGELVAELRWIPNSLADEEVALPSRRQRIAEELGDVVIAVLLFADRVKLDVIDAATRKLAMNEIKYAVEKVRGLPEITD